MGVDAARSAGRLSMEPCRNAALAFDRSEIVNTPNWVAACYFPLGVLTD